MDNPLLKPKQVAEHFWKKPGGKGSILRSGAMSIVVAKMGLQQTVTLNRFVSTTEESALKGSEKSVLGPGSVQRQSLSPMTINEMDTRSRFEVMRPLEAVALGA